MTRHTRENRPYPCNRFQSFLALILLAGALNTKPSAIAAPTDDPSPRKAATDLSLVPRSASGFIHIRSADLWNSNVMADVRHFIFRAGIPALAEFEKKFTGIPATIERITLFTLTAETMFEPFPSVDPEAVSALAIFATSKPFDREQLVNFLSPELREKKYKDKSYWFIEDLWSGVVVVDDRTFLIGSEDALLRYFDLPDEKRTAGPLQPLLEETAMKHHLVVAVNGVLLAEHPNTGQIPQPFQKLFTVKNASLTVDFSKELQLDLRLDFGREDQAKEGEKAFRESLNMARAALATPILEAEKHLAEQEKDKIEVSDLPTKFVALLRLGSLRELDHQLKNVALERRGTVVGMPLRLPERADVVGLVTVSMVGSYLMSREFEGRFMGRGFREKDSDDPMEAHFKNLAEAMENYHKDKGSYPPQASCDKDGKPLLSWRVLLLPYLGEQELYKQFKLDEPWDSLHNKKLIKQMPKAYQAPEGWMRWRHPDLWKTADQVFSGEGTVFESKKGVRKDDVNGQTILFVLRGDNNSVYWSKPADVPIAAGKSLPNLFGKHGKEVPVLLADGTFQRLQQGTDEKAIRAMIVRKKAKE